MPSIASDLAQSLPSINLLVVLRLTTVAIVAYTILSILYTYFFGNLSHLPGPWWSKVTALPQLYNLLIGNHANFIHNLHSKYGRVVRVTPALASMSDLDSLHTVFGSFKNRPFDKDPVRADKFINFRGAEYPNLGGMADYKDALARRRMYGTMWSAGNMLKKEADFERCFQRYREKIIHYQRENKDHIVDMLHEAKTAALDAACELAFGSVRSDQGDDVDWVRLIDRALVAVNLRAVSVPIYNFLKSLPFQFLDWTRNLDAYGNASIRLVEKYQSEKASNTSDGGSILGTLADAQAMQPKLAKPPKDPQSLPRVHADPIPYLTNSHLESEILGFLFAGNDTTANSIVYTFWELCQHPDLLTRLRSELDSVFPDVDLHSAMPIKSLETCTYLTNCIQEAMRLHPSFPGPSERVVNAGGAVLGGWPVKAGTLVSVQAKTTQLDPAYFPNPLAFDPDRWAHPTPDMKAAFLAFSAGPRVCLGKNLAWVTMRFLVGWLVRHYYITIPRENRMETALEYFTSQPAQGTAPFRLVERRDVQEK